MTPARHRVLIVSASMGAGHDAAAAELARRLRAAGAEAEVVDALALLPLGLGRALRRWYGWMMRSAPWVYELIYRIFFVSPTARPGATDDGGRIQERNDPRAAGGRRGDGAPRAVYARTSPLTVLAAARLRRLVLRSAPDEVVSAFHVAAQAAGRLRERGELPVPGTVLLTDFAVHRMWLHPGNDRYLCPCPATARRVTALTGRPAACHAPLVRPEFHRTVRGSGDARARQDGDRSERHAPEGGPTRSPERLPDGGAAGPRHTGLLPQGTTSGSPHPAPHPTGGAAGPPHPGHRPSAGSIAAERVRLRLGAGRDDRVVLVSAGSWGVGDVAGTARLLADSGRYVPVVLCGRNEDLRRRLAGVGAGPALGWRDDLPELMAAAYALIDNAAGLTCREAFAVGLPVISYRPIPGHGRDGVLAMARAGLTAYAHGEADLLAALDRLRRPAERARRIAAGAALFAAPAAETLLLNGVPSGRDGSPRYARASFARSGG